MENISWVDRVRNNEVLPKIQEDRNIQHTINGRKANWIGQILRRYYLLKYVFKGEIDEKTEVTDKEEEVSS